MKKIIILAIMLIGATVFANHHESSFERMIEIKSGSLGFDVDTAKAELERAGNKSESDIKSYNLDLNYAHAINPQFWVQGLLSYSKIKTDTDTTSGGTVTSSTSKEDSYRLGIAAIYNFDHEVVNSFYAKIGLGVDVSDDESSNIKVDLTTLGIEFGKRWSLERLTGIKNLSYYASISYLSGSGDTSISGTDVDTDVKGLTINLLGIALFF